MKDYYEIMYILRPDLSDEQVAVSVKKYNDILEANGVTDLEVQIRGKRRLAYPIKRQRDGIYIQYNYTNTGKEIAPLERAMRLSEDVIRYLSLKIDPPVVESEEEETPELVEA